MSESPLQADCALNCLVEVFQPYWPTEPIQVHGTDRVVSPLDLYVQPPHFKELLMLKQRMSPQRSIARAVVVGQRGTGKSTDLAWLANELRETHVVLWFDVIQELAEVLEGTIPLYVAIALTVYEVARQLGAQPDQELLEAFLSTCLKTVTEESVREESFKLKLNEVFGTVAQAITTISLPLAAATAQPLFMVAGGLAAAISMLMQLSEAQVGSTIKTEETETTLPEIDLAAARLNLFLRDVERRCHRPVLVVIDGLDRVTTDGCKQLFQRARDLARPNLRLILTAPLILYATPEFEHLHDHFENVALVPNVLVSDSADKAAHNFVCKVLEQRTLLCKGQLTDIFPEPMLEKLVATTGGNLRDTIKLAKLACDHALAREDTEKAPVPIDEESMLNAINDYAANEIIGGAMRADYQKALREFYESGSNPLPPGGSLGDTLLNQRWILAYKDQTGFLRYALHPVVRQECIDG